MPQALQGLRVLDLSETIAGQFCTRMLADYGADVVLIEPPSGSGIRSQGPFDPRQDPAPSLLFFHCNHGKRSVTLDHAGPPGHKLLLELSRAADVIVVGAGIDRDALQAASPNAVIALVSSFGDDGVYRDWRGTEMVHVALSGMMNHNGLGEREPLYGCGNRSSYAAGVCAYISVLAGVFARKKIGRGQKVQVDVVETASSMGYPYATQHVYNGWLEPRGERGQPFAVLKCADGWVAVWIREEHWIGACDAFGLPELTSDPRFTGTATRQSNWDTLVAIVQAQVKTLPADELVARLQARKVIAAKAWQPTDLYGACPHLTGRGYWESVETADGPRPVLGPQFRMSATPRQLRAGPPEVGESNAAIYSSLGLAAAQIDSLRRAGVI